jgi:hypothetical protein
MYSSDKNYLTENYRQYAQLTIVLIIPVKFGEISSLVFDKIFEGLPYRQLFVCLFVSFYAKKKTCIICCRILRWPLRTMGLMLFLGVKCCNEVTFGVFFYYLKIFVDVRYEMLNENSLCSRYCTLFIKEEWDVFPAPFVL